MPSRFDETRTKAVRLVRDHVGDYESEWAAIKVISARLGISAQTLRRWVRQAAVDAGEAAGVPSESAREICKLTRKCAERERTIEVLKAATTFFASQCQDDRPGGVRSFLCCPPGRPGRCVGGGGGREFGIGWRTAMTAVRDYGTPRVDDPTRLDGVEAIGVDETAFQAPSARRPTRACPVDLLRRIR
jgi:transposase